MANQNNFFLSSGLHHDSNFLRSLPDEDEQSASNHGPPWLDRSRQSRHSPGDRRLPWSPLQQSPPAAAAFTTQANSYTGPEYRPVISGSSNSHYLEARSFLFNTPGRARHQEPSRPTLTYASVPLDHQIPRFIPPAVESPSNLDQYINEPHPDPAVRQHFLWPSDPEPIMPSASRPRKRSAAEATTERPKKARHDSEELEEVNLTSDDPIEAALEKERQELVKSQQKDSEDEPKSFGKMSCIICMDNFTDA
ncbi:Hypothetical protein D9617_14g077630 [Elsinoe fawcettii]|nr:Hypothetical protein D9617_14g077630 [Elsinoe fawcettii]